MSNRARDSIRLSTRALAIMPADGSEESADADPVFRLSTPAEATDGHIVRPFWDLSRSEGAGIPLLFGHDQTQIAGRMHSIRLEGADLVGVARFDLGSELGRETRRMVREGFLSSVSIGWLPGEQTRRSELPKAHPDYREPAEDECGFPAEGFVMGSNRSPNTLLEVSLVSVPADPRANVISRSLSMYGAESVADLLRSVMAQPGSADTIRRFVVRTTEEQIRTQVEAAMQRWRAEINPTPKTRRLTFVGGRFTEE
jgi:phage head maturation protease